MKLSTSNAVELAKRASFRFELEPQSLHQGGGDRAVMSVLERMVNTQVVRT